jgi:tRNA pseudouridine55 synthase
MTKDLKYMMVEPGSLVGARDDTGPRVVLAYKPQGMTPFQLVEVVKRQILRQAQDDPSTALRASHADSFSVKRASKIGYAGRLDPMAEGLMVLLVGEENKKRKEYERLPKTYEFEVLFGVATDSYDVLGQVIPGVMLRTTRAGLQKDINNYLECLVGEFEQEYPPFSSPIVNGKPLFWWAREGRIDEIKLPSKKVSVSSAKLLGVKNIGGEELFENIKTRVGLVEGDFRQELILSSWEDFFEYKMQDKFLIAKIKIECSSGTYVRSIANDMGNKLGCGAIALKIVRTRVGEWGISSLLS